MITKKDDSIEMGKVIAALLVVIGHSAFLSVETNIIGLGVDVSNIIIDSTLIKKIFDCIVGVIYSCHMELFMVLSGMVYHICTKNDKYNDIRKFVGNKFNRLVITYVLVSIMFSIPSGILCEYFGNPIDIKKIVLYLIGFGKNHLWFLITLFYIYLLVRLIRKKMLLYIVCMFSVFANYFSRKIYAFEFLYIDRLMLYLMWFLVGVFIQERMCFWDKLGKTIRKIVIICILSGWTLFYCLSRWSSVYIISLIATLFGVLFFLLLSRELVQGQHYVLSNYFYRLLEQNTFEIYLYGTPVNYLIFAIIGLFFNSHNPWILNNITSALFIIFRICCQIVLPLIISHIIRKWHILKIIPHIK